MSFRKWVAQLGGVSACARLLGVTRYSVYAWLGGKSTPRAPMVEKIVKASNGALTFSGVVRETTRRAGARRGRAV